MAGILENIRKGADFVFTKGPLRKGSRAQHLSNVVPTCDTGQPDCDALASADQQAGRSFGAKGDPILYMIVKVD